MGNNISVDATNEFRYKGKNIQYFNPYYNKDKKDISNNLILENSVNLENFNNQNTMNLSNNNLMECLAKLSIDHSNSNSNYSYSTKTLFMNPGHSSPVVCQTPRLTATGSFENRSIFLNNDDSEASSLIIPKTFDESYLMDQNSALFTIEQSSNDDDRKYTTKENKNKTSHFSWKKEMKRRISRISKDKHPKDIYYDGSEEDESDDSNAIVHRHTKDRKRLKSDITVDPSLSDKDSSEIKKEEDNIGSIPIDFTPSNNNEINKKSNFSLHYNDYVNCISSNGTPSITLDTGSSISTAEYELTSLRRYHSRVNVVLRWRDSYIQNETCKSVSIISEDILTSVQAQNSGVLLISNFSMTYDKNENNWVLPDLFLPPGKYRLRFLIDHHDFRYSNYLPVTEDELGTIINEIEILPGYKSVEPFEHNNHIMIQENIINSELSLNNSRQLQSEPPSYPELEENFSSPIESIISEDELDNDQYSKVYGKRNNSIGQSKTSLSIKPCISEVTYTNEIPQLFKITDNNCIVNENYERYGFVEPPSYGEPGLENRVIDCNQDILFATFQQNGAVDVELAEQLFLEKYPVPDLPVFLDSHFSEKLFDNNDSSKNLNDMNGEDIQIKNNGQDIPHVNLNHVLTNKISNGMISVACTTRYKRKFVTHILYSPSTHSEVGF
ncbi:hypothetical protein Kpol_1023p98 [Vanderwaltozyma polyspora DSM 70294]|uniref:Association with the SNF1 complex (ASC) domain-containing protein n=1 Tax=Vanderwaltozyma polyspora (strain ATCC 22028 / DSM 70294 / BCRC 21397 / CBS 2163 / NBRC 10782 / NRRL Y-8283 / UCD 57-17) TaxID=436907 RepID=A7TFW7_VANPO|nr:uncharacterized protein Kpol_1023p98 [Vanderwaltozyma polyspora DSM 70294]EDO18925.1 hypothetical protein Kpol_1023p98 [Vanderwaltozyma polyspora DSM 70294]